MTLETAVNPRKAEAQRREHEKQLRKQIRSLNGEVKEFIDGAALFATHPDTKDTTLKLGRPKNFSPMLPFMTDFFTVDAAKYPDVRVEARLRSDKSGNHMTVALVTGNGEDKQPIRHVTVTTDSISPWHARIEIEGSNAIDPRVVSLHGTGRQEAFYGSESLRMITHGPVEGQIAFAENMKQFIIDTLSAD